jgi:ribosomal protein L11 methyltransferase
LKTYPAIDVLGESPDLILAAVDGFGPTAAEERGLVLRVFFATPEARNAARAALATQWSVNSVDVPDDDWARRSQENLTPVTVGRITILPDQPDQPDPPGLPGPPGLPDRPDPPALPALFAIVIRPSMGFGTGHHATTRLCLRALQGIGVTGKTVLDIGTGSGVLAIAASRLGASRVVGLDHDPDALQSARENLALNPDSRRTTFVLADLMAQPLSRADLVTANLTGSLLARAAPSLLAAVGSGGILIVSGLLAHERDDVCRSFSPSSIVWEQEEDGWVGIAFRKV